MPSQIFTRLMSACLGVAAVTAAFGAHAQGAAAQYYFPPTQPSVAQPAPALQPQTSVSTVSAPNYIVPAQPAPSVAAEQATSVNPSQTRPLAIPPQRTATAQTYEFNDTRPPVTASTRYYPAAPGAQIQVAAAQPATVTTPTYESHVYVERPYQAPPAPIRPVSSFLAPPPAALPLTTRPGIDVGIQGSYYRYRESAADVTNLGAMLGFTGAGTMVFNYGWFAGIDGRFAFSPGGTDYRGSGTASGEQTDLWEVRATGGKDFIFEYFVVSPFIGLGYRELYNDARGVSSTGASGYRRLNQMLYMPVGFSPRFRLTGETRIAAKVEYDATLLGIQHSDLSDVSPAFSNMINRQTNGGSGVRAEVMFETQSWSAGPFFNYWDIGDSKGKNQAGSLCTSFGAPSPCTLLEPRNHTTEGGIQIRYHFL